MKKITILSAIAMLMVACGGGPKSVAEDFTRALYTCNTEKAITLAGLKKGTQDGEFVAGKLGAACAEMKEKGMVFSGIKESTVTSESDSSASVRVTSKFKNGSTETDTINLYKEDGKWIVKL